MTILFRKPLRSIRRRWRSQLDADKPSWAARAILRSLDGEAPSESAECKWNCRRAPIFVRVFGRAGKGRA